MRALKFVQIVPKDATHCVPSMTSYPARGGVKRSTRNASPSMEKGVLRNTPRKGMHWALATITLMLLWRSSCRDMSRMASLEMKLCVKPELRRTSRHGVHHCRPGPKLTKMVLLLCRQAKLELESSAEMATARSSSQLGRRTTEALIRWRRRPWPA